MDKGLKLLLAGGERVKMMVGLGKKDSRYHRDRLKRPEYSATRHHSDCLLNLEYQTRQSADN